MFNLFDNDEKFEHLLIFNLIKDIRLYNLFSHNIKFEHLPISNQVKVVRLSNLLSTKRIQRRYIKK